MAMAGTEDEIRREVRIAIDETEKAAEQKSMADGKQMFMGCLTMAIVLMAVKWVIGLF